MSIIETLAERHIQRAIERGEFENLEGEGKPLELEPDDPFVAPELRMAYRVMKNAGYLPPEVCIRKEIHQLSELMRITADTSERSRAEKRMNYLLSRLDMLRPNRSLAVEQQYFDHLKQQLQG